MRVELSFPYEPLNAALPRNLPFPSCNSANHHLHPLPPFTLLLASPESGRLLIRN